MPFLLFYNWEHDEVEHLWPKIEEFSLCVICVCHNPEVGCQWLKRRIAELMLLSFFGGEGEVLGLFKILFL